MTTFATSPRRTPAPSRRLTVLGLLPLALLAACGGGGGDDSGTGTMRVAMTDAPACGFKAVNVTVERVRVHQSATAADADGGWQDITLAAPKQIDLLSLTNGVLVELGSTALPAGRYTQIRLQLSGNSALAPLANSVVLDDDRTVPLDTPSALQSGLKMKADIDVAADQVADVVLDFDACKSVVKLGQSGRYNLKPVLRVLPRVTSAGLAVVGYVAPAMAASGAQVSLQLDGVPVRATPPDATGKFTLSPVPAGTYDLVVAADGRVTATMTGVPVTTTAITTVNAPTSPIDPPAATMRTLSGTVVTGATPVNATVRATKTYAGGPTVEVAGLPVDGTTGAFSLSLPASAAVKTAYAAGATSFTWTADTAAPAGGYTLEAASGTAVKSQAVNLTTADVLNLGITLP